MEERRIPSIVINVFKCYYTQIMQGAQARPRTRRISPLSEDEVPAYEDSERYADAGRDTLRTRWSSS